MLPVGATADWPGFAPGRRVRLEQGAHKAKVEVGVQIAERWLLARIRNETFTSLGALNARLAELTADLNGRTMRTYKASRRDLFERLDRPELTPLPAEPFEASTWKKVALNIDDHVAFDDHFYSAPHALRHEDIELWLRATASAVEIFHGRERVTAHVRSYVRGGYTTKPEHMPSSHRAHAEWTPSPHPRLGRSGRPQRARTLRSDPARATSPRVGLPLLPRTLPPREEVWQRATSTAASRRALYAGARSYRPVLTILQHNLDRQPLPESEAPATAGAVHENVRGADYYH